jgi:predicted nucleic acid-binding protein
MERNMAFKIILDANILIDLTLQHSDDYEDLALINQKIVDHTFQGFITTSIIYINAYWITKALGTDNTKKVLITILNDLKVIDASHSIIEDALYSDMKDIVDALQYYAALHYRLDFFISRDKQFIRSGKSILPVIHPKDFIKTYIH